MRFYRDTQKRSVGKLVNDAGYTILRKVDLDARTVLEIGPGSMPHLPFWTTRPEKLVIADIDQRMLDLSAARLEAESVACQPVLLAKSELPRLPFDDAAFDVVMSFYSLEHLHPIGAHLDEIVRCLKPGGLLAGAIPAEGGLAWGLGRFLTSRRWLLRHTGINPDKIICWEHPNFAEDVLDTASRRLERRHLSFFPLRLPLLDLNLIVRFIFRKPDAEVRAPAARK